MNRDNVKEAFANARERLRDMQARGEDDGQDHGVMVKLRCSVCKQPVRVASEERGASFNAIDVNVRVDWTGHESCALLMVTGGGKA